MTMLLFTLELFASFGGSFALGSNELRIVPITLARVALTGAKHMRIDCLFLFLSSLKQIVYSLHQVRDCLLLLVKLLKAAVKIAHQFVKLFVLAVVVRLFTCVEKQEFLLEFFLCIRLVLLLAIHIQEVTEFWFLFAVADIDHYPHYNVLKHDFTVRLPIIDCTNCSRHLHDIV